MTERAAFTINIHIDGATEPTGYSSGSCMLCDYTSRDFINNEEAAKAAVVKHISDKHGRRHSKMVGVG